MLSPDLLVRAFFLPCGRSEDLLHPRPGQVHEVAQLAYRQAGGQLELGEQPPAQDAVAGDLGLSGGDALVQLADFRGEFVNVHNR